MNRDWRGWEDDIAIVSSENVGFSIETAGVGSRLGAALADYLLQILVVATIVLSALFIYDKLPNAGWVKWLASVSTALLILVYTIIFSGYHFLFEWLWDGQTPGKRWMGLRVLQSDGMPAGVWPLLVRNALRTVDFLPFAYGVGGLVALSNPYNRRIGDFLAGTVVAREKHMHGKQNRALDIGEAIDAFLVSMDTKQALGASTAVPAPAVASATPPTPDWAKGAEQPPTPQSTPVTEAVVDVTEDSLQQLMMSRLDNEDRELLLNFMHRRKQLRPQVRTRLAQSLSLRLSTRLGLETPPVESSELFLQTLVMALDQNSAARK